MPDRGQSGVVSWPVHRNVGCKTRWVVVVCGLRVSERVLAGMT